jgi:hypothetical protein
MYGEMSDLGHSLTYHSTLLTSEIGLEADAADEFSRTARSRPSRDSCTVEASEGLTRFVS